MDPVWAETVEVESLRLTVVVDNVTDMLSEPCAACAGGPEAACSVSSERTRNAAAVRAGAAPCFDFRNKLLAAHGLSLLLEAVPVGGGPPRTLLFDAGPERAVWRNNAERLGLDVGAIEAVVLSHWHMDHSGGLPEVAAMIAEARSASRPPAAAATGTGAGGTSPASPASPALPPKPPVPFDVHPARPACRGSLAPDGRAIPYNPDPQLAELALAGATRVEQHAEAHTLCGGCFYVSGAIPRLTPYEQGNPANASQWREGGPWEPDPEVADERFVAVRVRGRGAVLLSACSHAGVVNVMRAAQAAAGGAAPFAVIGGLHLSTADCLDRIDATVADIAELAPALVVAGHCTGWRAQAALINALPSRCMPGSVGCTFEFRALPAAAAAAD